MGNDIKNINGTYMGKQLIKKVAGQYTTYKAVFKVGDKDWNFYFFMNFVSDGVYSWKTKLGADKKGFAPSALEEGKKYNVGYTEYQAEGKQYPSKTAMIFQEPKEGNDTPQESTAAATPASSTVFNFDKETTDEIIITYLKLKKPEEQNINHFVGTVIRTLYNDNVALNELIGKYKVAKGEVPPKVETELVE